MVKNKKTGSKTHSTTKVILFTALIALLPLVAAKFSHRDKIAMFYDDHIKMEQEILRVLPVGSSAQNAKQGMLRNGFYIQKQTLTVLEFEKETWPFPQVDGTAWSVQILLKNGAVAGVKVWIYPSD